MLLVAVSFGLAAGLLLYFLRFHRRGNLRQRKETDSNLRLNIGFSDLDGMATLALLVSNKGETDIWIEEIEIFLSELEATFQSGVPSYHGIQSIRGQLSPGEKSSISLSTAIYKAGGQCQRWYSFVLSSVVRYRIGEEWRTKHLENYRVEMIGFITASVRRERQPLQGLKSENQPQNGRPVEEASKRSKSI